MKRLFVLFSILNLFFILSACGGGGITAGDLTIQDPWVRPSPMTAGNGAGYMVIENDGDTADALLSASVDFADVVEIHETTMSMSEGDDEGDMGQEMMTMHPVEKIEIPAGGSATLEPGGFHVMFIGVTEELVAGEMVTLTLTFENAGTVDIEAEVREQ